MTDLFEAEATTTTSLDLRRLQRMQRRATRRKWALALISVGLVLTAISGSVVYNFLQTTFERTETTVADYEGNGQGSVTVVIESGDTGSDMATALFDEGVVKSEQAFINEFNKNPDSASIKPGYYFMQREMKAEYALLALLDPNNRDLRKITVPEGKTVEFYYEKIADGLGVPIEEVREAAKDTVALGLPAEANGNLEGWLFPDTYSFNPGTTPADALREMIKVTIKVLDDAGVLPENRESVLTVASLVEREAKLAVDRPLIAGVIYNRLTNGMRLELDSTVKYISPSEGVFTSDEERASDSPYNTYKVTGLPPGPIAGPGAASIDAAVHPAQHTYLFFVTVDLLTGTTMYAETFPQHQQNVQVLQAWIAANQ